MDEVPQALSLKSAEDCIFPLLIALSRSSQWLRVWSSKVLAFHNSVFPSVQVCSGFLFPGCFTWDCVQVQPVWMDLADCWTRLLTAFIVLSPTNCISLLFLLSDPGWNEILHLTYANMKSIIECNFSLASFWDLHAGHFLILLAIDYVQFIFLTYGARSMPYKNLSMLLHLCSPLCKPNV